MKENFIAIVAQVAELERDKILLEDSPYNSNLDSLSLVELLVTIEREFEIEFDDEELFIGNYKTLNDLCEVVIKKVEETYGKDN